MGKISIGECIGSADSTSSKLGEGVFSATIVNPTIAIKHWPGAGAGVSGAKHSTSAWVSQELLHKGGCEAVLVPRREQAARTTFIILTGESS